MAAIGNIGYSRHFGDDPASAEQRISQTKIEEPFLKTLRQEII